MYKRFSIKPKIPNFNKLKGGYDGISDSRTVFAAVLYIIQAYKDTLIIRDIRSRLQSKFWFIVFSAPKIVLLQL